jgi:hypothetical protein
MRRIVVSRHLDLTQVDSEMSIPFSIALRVGRRQLPRVSRRDTEQLRLVWSMSFWSRDGRGAEIVELSVGR